MCGKMREPYVSFTSLIDDWRMLHGLQVCVVTNEEGISDATWDFLRVLSSVGVAELWLLNLTAMKVLDVYSIGTVPLWWYVKSREQVEELLDDMWCMGNG